MASDTAFLLMHLDDPLEVPPVHAHEREEEGDDERSDDDAEETEHLQAAEQREEDEPGVHLHLAAQEQGLSHVLPADDEDEAPGREHDGGRHVAGRSEQEDRGDPDDRGPYHRHEGGDGGEEPEEERVWDARDREAYRGQDPLPEGRDDGSDHGGIGDFTELRQELAGLARLQRRHRPQPLDEARPFEKQEVERDEHHHRVERGPAGARQHLRRRRADLLADPGDPFLDLLALEVDDAQGAVDGGLRPRRKLARLEVRDIGDAELAVEVVETDERLADREGGDAGERQDNGEEHRQREERRRELAPSAQESGRAQERPLENGGEHYREEERRPERPDHQNEKRGGDQDEHAEGDPRLARFGPDGGLVQGLGRMLAVERRLDERFFHASQVATERAAGSLSAASDRQLRRDHHLDPRPRLAERRLHLRRRVAPREGETEIARPFRKRNDLLVQVGRDHDVLDPGDALRRLDSADFLQHAAPADRQHEDARWATFALSRESRGGIDRVAEQKLFERDAHPETERPPAQPANGASGHLQDPGTVGSEPQLGVHRAVHEPEGAGRLLYRGRAGRLQRLRMAGGRHVQGLFEVGAVERVRLVEEREDGEVASGEQALDGNLRSRQELLDQDPGGFGIAPCADLRRAKEVRHPRERDVESRTVVGADDSAARGKRQRLHDARV